ncbi:MAG: methyltransferase domain-containing protein [Myxococcota bacterium]
MALQEFTIDLSNEELPTALRTTIDESDRRIDELFASGGNEQVPRYMPSDPELFSRVLSAVKRLELPLGEVFCEWGCGLGVCACIAAQLGYQAYGIELDPRMAEMARRFADDLGIQVEILETSYIPEGYDSSSGIGGEILIKEEPMIGLDGRDASRLRYEGMEPTVDEVDIFYAYPWPLEQDFIQELFDEVAGEGAILIVFHKSNEILTFRKTIERDHLAD